MDNTNMFPNNDNRQSNVNNENNIVQQQFTEYKPVEQQADIQHSSANEVIYYPPQNTIKPKIVKKKRRLFLKAFVAVLCVASISVGSVAGYVALTDNGYDIPFISSKDKDDNKDKKSDKDDDDAVVLNKDAPTLIQMAAREDALSVPEIVKKVAPSVVGISSKLSYGVGTGSGIIMSEDGYIITNAHVIEDATSITVVIKNDDNEDEEEVAEVIGVDTMTDLAVIKVNRKGLTPAEFGMSEDLQVGELAIAIGNPLGLELSGSVTGGIISALNRELSFEDRDLTLIQTDAAINPGNSGGPLVNSYGQVIGINSAKISSEYAEGLGFAIPIDDAKPIIDSLLKYGYVKDRPMLGIMGQTVTAAQARYNDVPQGVFVVSVTKDTGADKAGIKAGDIITAVNGKTVTTMAELDSMKKNFKAGDEITVSIYRDGKDFDLKVILTENKQ